MTAPVPFPVGAGSSGEPIIVISLSEIDDDGWVKTGDAEIIDWWSDPQPVGSAFVHGNNGLGTWFDELPPPRRDTQFAKTFGIADGFVPNQRYRFVVEARWQLGTGGDEASFLGTVINGVRGSLSGPIFEEPTRFYEIIAAADASGDVEIALLLDSIPTSSTWDANWYEIQVFPLLTPGDLADIIVNSAVLYAEGWQAISITRGGAEFDPREEWEDYDFPGKTAPVDGLRELVSMSPVVRATVMMTGETQIDAYRPGGSWADHATIEDGRTFTPGQMRTALSGATLSNFFCIWKRQRGDYIAVEFPKALCRRYGIHGRDKDEGELGVEFEAMQDLSGEGATPKTTPVYYLHLLPADFAPVAA